MIESGMMTPLVNYRHTKLKFDTFSTRAHLVTSLPTPNADIILYTMFEHIIIICKTFRDV